MTSSSVLAVMLLRASVKAEKRGHSVISVGESVPKVVWFTDAATHDHVLLIKLELNADTIYVFDKGYNDYKAL